MMMENLKLLFSMTTYKYETANISDEGSMVKINGRTNILVEALIKAYLGYNDEWYCTVVKLYNHKPGGLTICRI